ncbi:MAG: DUF3794 domain-containing protein [Firmicutes bacterium]|nr:DUF3794 domain-containing protein [Bacillota bacterium]
MIVRKQDLVFTTERLKVLKVIGEKVAQVVVESELPINAIKIDKIEARLGPFEDHVFHNKVVKQGVIHKQVFYVDPDNFVRHISEDIPYMLTVEIPGVKPSDFVEVQNHLIDIDTDFQLVPARPRRHGHDTDQETDAGFRAVLRQKVNAHILVKVSEWAQVDVVTGVDIFPKVNSMQRVSCS